MRRAAAWFLALGLVGGLLSAAPPAGGQSPTITLSFDDGGSPPSAVTGVAEEGGAQTVRVVATASAQTSAQVEVTVTIAAGTAAVADYEVSATSTTVTIASGDMSGESAALQVTPVNDAIVEGDETITVSATASGYTIDNVNLLIFDDDNDEILLSVSKDAVEEGDAEDITVTARFAGSPSVLTSATAVTVTLAAADSNGATPDTDFTATGTGVNNNEFTISIPAGNRGASRLVSLAATSDFDNSEGPEAVAVSGSATVTGSSATVTGTRVVISDPGELITLGFEDGRGSEVTEVDEDGGAQTVRVTASITSAPAADTTVVVYVGAAGGSAFLGAGGDYTRGARTTNVTIRAGATSGGADVTITPLSDRITEDDETIRFTGIAAGYTVRSASLQIADGDRTILFSAPEVDLREERVRVARIGGGIRADLGSGDSRDSFVSSTSSTYSNVMRPRIMWRNGTARQGGVGADYQSTIDRFHRFIKLDAHSISSTGSVDSQDRGGTFGSVSVNKGWSTNTVANGNKTYELDFVDLPAGFKSLPKGYVIYDNESVVTLSVDTNSGEDGDQSTLEEGASGSGVGVSASFPSGATSSSISSDTTVTLSAAGEDNPRPGRAGDADLTYAPSSANTITFQARSLAASGTAMLSGLSVVDDSVVEGPETFTVGGSSNLNLATVRADTITIVDDDADITLSVSPAGAAEGAGAVDMTVTARFAGSSSVLTSATEVTVTLAAAATGGAAPGTDFTVAGDGVMNNNQFTVSIPAGMTEGSKTVQVTAATDSDNTEGLETVEVSGSATVGSAVDVTDAEFFVADPGSAVSLSFTDAQGGAVTGVDERGGAQTVRVAASVPSGSEPASDVAVTVNVGAGGGTADAESCQGSGGGRVCTGDYASGAETVTITIPNGQRSGTADVTITPRVDGVAEGAETVRFTGTAAGYVVTGADLEITEAIEITASPALLVEQAAAHTITVTAGFAGAARSVLGSDTTVNIAVSTGDANGASLATSCPSASDDACTNSSTFNIIIPAGQTSAAGTFDVNARADMDAESVETLKVTGTAAGGAISDSETLRIADDVIGVELLDQGGAALTSVGEGDGSASVRVRVTMPAASASRRVVGLNIRGGSATADADNAFTIREDYRVSGLTAPTGTPSGHALGVEVAANAMQGTQTFTITVNDDNVDEEDETIRITGGDVGGIPISTAGLSITDNDDAPANIDLAVTLEDSQGRQLDAVQEDGGTTVVRVRASYQGTTVSDEEVNIPITVGGSAMREATSGADYQAVGGVEVAIGEYASSGETTFNLVIGPNEDDATAEGPETVTITGSATGFTVGDASFTIIDDDSMITLTLPALSSLEEGTEATAVAVRASYPAGVSLSAEQTMQISVDEGTASSSSDYLTTLPSPSQIAISAGQNSGTGTFTLALDGPRDDDISEEDETLTVSGVLEGFNVLPATFTIADDDDPPIGISMSASPLRPAEGSTAQVTVRFTESTALSSATRVTITRAGRAGSSDYNAPRTVTIPAGATQIRFPVSITNDSVQEPDETIILTARTDYGEASLTLTIPANDEPQPGGGGGGGGPTGGGGGGGPTGGGGGGGPTGGGGGGGPTGGGGAPPPVGPVTPPPPAEPACQGRFCDEDGSVHEANIERIAGWEITLGCDAQDSTKYCPSAQITRRQMAAFLYRAVSQRWTIQTPEGVEISDVPADAWYRSFADWVVSVGAFAAPEGVFNPGGVVTRADMAVMMIAAFPHLDAVEEAEGLFNDVAGVDPAVVRAVEGMYQTGVTRGCTAAPLNYCPDQPVTRAQMASFFVRAIDLVPAADNPG